MDSTTISVPAVILSGNLGNTPGKKSMNEAALALTRSLGRHGVKVYRFHPDCSLFDLESRYCTHVPCPNLYDDPQGLAQQLVAFAREVGCKPVLFPASDGAAQFIADHEGLLAEAFALSSPNASCIARTQHKRELIEVAESLGVPVPATFFPSSVAQLRDIAGRVNYPLIVKPLYSPDWKRPAVTAVFGVMKALKVSSPAELVDKCSTLLTLGSTFMVQEIISGPDENLITFLGYAGRDGEILTGCVRKKLRQFPAGYGYCCATESTDDPEVFDLSMKLLRSLDYRGIGCAEFKRDPCDGLPKLIEINTRAVRTSMLAIGAGVDFPWVAYQDLTGIGPAEPSFDVKVPVRWVHLRDELWAAGGLILQRRLSFIDWAKGYIGKPLVTAEFSWDDARPGLLLWMQIPAQLFKRLWQKVRVPSASGPAASQGAGK